VAEALGALYDLRYFNSLFQSARAGLEANIASQTGNEHSWAAKWWAGRFCVHLFEISNY
jgi:hypothetical protein